MGYVSFCMRPEYRAERIMMASCWVLSLFMLAIALVVFPYGLYPCTVGVEVDIVSWCKDGITYINQYMFLIDNITRVVYNCGASSICQSIKCGDSGYCMRGDTNQDFRIDTFHKNIITSTISPKVQPMIVFTFTVSITIVLCIVISIKIYKDHRDAGGTEISVGTLELISLGDISHDLDRP